MLYQGFWIFQLVGIYRKEKECQLYQGIIWTDNILQCYYIVAICTLMTFSAHPHSYPIKYWTPLLNSIIRWVHLLIHQRSSFSASSHRRHASSDRSSIIVSNYLFHYAHRDDWGWSYKEWVDYFRETGSGNNAQPDKINLVKYNYMIA